MNVATHWKLLKNRVLCLLITATCATNTILCAVGAPIRLTGDAMANQTKSELLKRIDELESFIGCSDMCSTRNKNKCMVQIQRDYLLDMVYHCGICKNYSGADNWWCLGECKLRHEPRFAKEHIHGCFMWNGEGKKIGRQQN